MQTPTSSQGLHTSSVKCVLEICSLPWHSQGRLLLAAIPEALSRVGVWKVKMLL